MMITSNEKLHCIKIMPEKNIILRIIPGDPPIIYNTRAGFFIVISKDLATFLKLCTKGLTVGEAIAKLDLNKHELDSLIGTINMLVKEGYLHVEYVC